MFLSNDKYEHEVSKLIEESENLDIAVAFWGKGACEEIKKSTGKVRLLCNLTSGGTNPAEIRKIMELADTNNITLRHRDDLHAKVFIGSRKMIIGSANMSTNGLGLNPSEFRSPKKRWAEAGILSDISDSTQAWFASLFENSANVTQQAIEDAQRTFDSVRKKRPFLQKENYWGKILNGEFDEESVSGRNIFVATYFELPSDEALEAAKESQQSGEIVNLVDFFEDWTPENLNSSLGMEPRQTILSINTSNGGPICDGFWRIKRNEKRSRNASPKEEMTLHLCEFCGEDFYIPKPDNKVWGKILKRLQENGHNDDVFGKTPRLINFETFVSFLKPKK